MLYVSTRNKTDSFTAHRALHEQRAPDGGLYVPFRIPYYTPDEIRDMQCKSFGENVALILNVFFSAQLSGWDVDFCIGRHPVMLEAMSHRIVVAELWRNPGATYSHMIQSLYAKLSGDPDKKPTRWAKVAIQIAILFGLYAQMSKMNVEGADIAVAAGDFVTPMAAWYARKMGLAVRTIICGCNENSTVWDLIHRGEFNTGLPKVDTDLSELDVSCPAGVEDLIYQTLGTDAVTRYLKACDKGSTYAVYEYDLQTLSDGLWVSVVGKERIGAIINSVYRTNDYIVDPYTALNYGSLQDYRSRTGESRHTLLLAEHDPLLFRQTICTGTGLTPEMVIKKVNTPKE